MKILFRASGFLAICMFLVGCSQAITPTASPISTLTKTVTPTITPSPTIRPEYVPPTLISTIDPTLVPELLRNAFSVQTAEGLNGHKIRRITGWAFGYGYCPGIVWLDTNHLLLYPGAGQEEAPVGMGIQGINVVPQPVIISLDTGYVWLPKPAYGGECKYVYWSRDLGIIISPGINSSPYNYDEKEAVFTYTFDGQDVAYYWGKLLGVSPSGTKILVADDTIIDLHDNKITELAWYINYDIERSPELYWTDDEMRIYRCCYYFADLTNGKSFSFNMSDLRQSDGRPGPSSMLPPGNGEWVRNDTYFLAEWSWMDDGDIRYLPMFDPATKKYYDVREMAGIPQDLSCPQTAVSPNGSYVWVMCFGTDYLVNLSNFETKEYPGYSLVDIGWSADNKFAWLNNQDNDHLEILSLVDKTLKLFPINPAYESLEWHPTANILAYLTEDKESLIILNAQTMTVQNLGLPSPIYRLIWSPSGEQLILLAEDGSIWQVDYPNLQRFEQLTRPLPNVSDLTWSPDGNFVSFVSSSEIYIVDTAK